MMLINPSLLNRKAGLAIEVNIEFPHHCETSDTQFTQLNEPFDEGYIEEVLK